jgi:hypothetical protein
MAKNGRKKAGARLAQSGKTVPRSTPARSKPRSNGVFSSLKKSGIISSGLQTVANNTSGPFSLAANIGSKIAGSLGFSTPLGNNAEGGSVTSSPMPIQFPRLPGYKAGVTSYAHNGTTFAHTMDLVAPAVTPLAQGTFSIAGDSEFSTPANTFFGSVRLAVSPTSGARVGSSATLPLANNIAQNFDQWKLHGLRIHYEHFCPSTTQGSVYLYYTPNSLLGNTFGGFQTDPWNGSVGIPPIGTGIASFTETSVAESQYVMQGAVYEDCFLEVDLSQCLDPNKWYYTTFPNSVVADGTPISGFDNIQIMAGTPQDSNVGEIGIYLGNGPVITGPTDGGGGTSVGKLWVEAFWEFTSLQFNSQTTDGNGLNGFARAARQGRKLRPLSELVLPYVRMASGYFPWADPDARPFWEGHGFKTISDLESAVTELDRRPHPSVLAIDLLGQLLWKSNHRSLAPPSESDFDKIERPCVTPVDRSMSESGILRSALKIIATNGKSSA